MKSLIRSLFCFFCLVFASTTFAAIPFDDFSSNSLDPSKYQSYSWNQLEQVREISAGKFVSKIMGRSDITRMNSLAFVDPETIDSISANVSIVDFDTNFQVQVIIGGYFYKDSGGEDIHAYVFIENNGNNLYAAYEILGSSPEPIKREIFELSVQVNEEYLLKIEYDETLNEFSFSVGDEILPPISATDRAGVAYSQMKALTTQISGDGSDYVSSLSATFDDVMVNDKPYDDFTTGPLDSTSWTTNEIVKEVRDGQLQANIQSFGTDEETINVDLNTPEAKNFFQADVTVESGTVLNGDHTYGQAKVRGPFLNYTASGENYGNIYAESILKYTSDGEIRPGAWIYQYDDSSISTYTILFTHDFSCTARLDKPVTLSIENKDNTFTFGCNNEHISHTLPGTLYPRPPILTLRTRIYSTEGQSGYFKVKYDNIYTEKNTFPWNAYMPAILIDRDK